jgi:elongation factor Ts
VSNEISAARIKELRDRTGVGMGKCKEALEAAKGDMELAIANLRKAGIASAVKKEGRATNEGMIGIAENGKTIALVEVNAETDFVVKNDRFQQFLRDVADEVVSTTPATVDDLKAQKLQKDKALTIEEYRATVVQTIGENIQIRRLKTLAKAPNKSIGVYSHLGGKLVTVVEITGSAKEEALAKDIAMHVAAAAPEYLSEKDVPADVLANEREIAKGQVKGKPDNIVEKIVDGKINAYYDAACLTRQKFIKDDSKTIAEVVSQHGKDKGVPLTVTAFYRWTVGQ